MTFWGMTICSDTPLDQTLHQLMNLIPNWTYLPNLTFTQLQEVSINICATDVSCQQRTFAPPDTWPCLALGLSCVVMLRLREIFPKYVFFLDIEFRTSFGTLMISKMLQIDRSLPHKLATNTCTYLYALHRRLCIYEMHITTYKMHETIGKQLRHSRVCSEYTNIAIHPKGSGDGRVIKLLACGTIGPGFYFRPRHLNFQRVFISCFQVAIWLKYRWSDVNPQYNQTNNQPTKATNLKMVKYDPM